MPRLDKTGRNKFENNEVKPRLIYYFGWQILFNGNETVVTYFAQIGTEITSITDEVLNN